MNRKYMLKLILVIAVFCAVMIFGASFAYADMTLSDSDVTLKAYNTKQLTYSTTGYEIGITKWVSSNSDVASVDDNGLVTAVGVGEATITVSKGSSKASCKVHVIPIKLKECTITGLNNFTYAPYSLNLEDVMVTYNNQDLLYGRRVIMTYDYENNNAGTHVVTFTSGTPNVDDEGVGIQRSFEIYPQDIDYVNMEGFTPDSTYTGNPCYVKVKLKADEPRFLEEGKDYTLSYKNNILPGTATVTINGIGNYKGSYSKDYVIRADLGKAVSKTYVQPLARKTCTGYAIKPTPYVNAVGTGGKVVRLVEGKDYKYSYENNIKVGRATLKINGIGNYIGTKNVYFTIYPKNATIKSVSPLRKGFRIVWNKQTVQTDGYQIQYSSRSDFKTYGIATITSNGIIAKNVYNLKARKGYYVRIRTYRVVNDKRYCSLWSPKKYVKTKA